MKSSISILRIVSLAFAAATVRAAPVDGMNEIGLSISTQFTESGLDNQELEINGGLLGFWEGATGEPVRVYPIDGAGAGLFSLHTLPIGIVDHALLLRDGPGLYSLVDDIPPERSGDGVLWDTFVLTDDSRLVLNETGSWLAFPAGDGDWDIWWYDGSAFLTQDYVAVDIRYTPVSGTRGA